jgi:hypothetical protein
MNVKNSTRRHARDGSAKTISVIVNESGLSSLDGSAFWSWRFGCRDGVYDAIGFDRMHVVKGLVENVLSALNWIIGSESPNQKQKAKESFVISKQAIMDGRFAKLPAFMGGQSVYIPSFTGGFYAKKRAEAWHLNVWLSLIVFVIGDDRRIINRHSTRIHFLTNVELLLEIVTVIWQVPSPSELQLLDFEHRVTQWQLHFKLHFIQTSPSQCNFDNFHKINHAADHARRNGGWASTCTSSYEKSHTLFAKNPAKHHNRKTRVEERMLKIAMKAAYYEDIGDTVASALDISADGAASSVASSSSSTRSNGAITRIRSNVSTSMYFRVRALLLPSNSERSFLREIRAAYAGIVSSSENSEVLLSAKQVDLDEIECWQFMKCKVLGRPTEHAIRAPKGQNYTSIDCGKGSFAKVLAIIDVRSVAVLAIQWYTPKFKGSSDLIPLSNYVARTHTRLVLTKKIVVIPVDHVVRVVHIVPDIDSTSNGIFFVNNAPLGTTMRAKEWEHLMSTTPTPCNDA